MKKMILVPSSTVLSAVDRELSDLDKEMSTILEKEGSSELKLREYLATLQKFLNTKKMVEPPTVKLSHPPITPTTTIPQFNPPIAPLTTTAPYFSFGPSSTLAASTPTSAPAGSSPATSFPPFPHYQFKSDLALPPPSKKTKGSRRNSIAQVISEHEEMKRLYSPLAIKRKTKNRPLKKKIEHVSERRRVRKSLNDNEWDEKFK